jgi:hypothetical protein
LIRGLRVGGHGVSYDLVLWLYAARSSKCWEAKIS